jgi:assimilatory nitrate reductase catalytic subunit
MSRTGTVGRLSGHVSEPAVDLHPDDLRRLAAREGDLLRLRSRRGSLVIPVRSSDAQRPGEVYVPMHWGEEFLTGDGGPGRALLGINALTQPAFCPTSRQPELKHAAVAIAPAQLPWQWLGMRWLDQAQALQLRQALMAEGRQWGYASATLFGREPEADGRVGVMLRLAAAAAPSAAQRRVIEQLLGLDAPEVMRYDDPVRQQSRAVRLRTSEGGERHIESFGVAGLGVTETWLRALLERQESVTALGQRLLSATPPDAAARTDRGRQVCTCFDVSDQAITHHLRSGQGTEDQRLARLQADLKCGTNCGSCIPALRKLVRHTVPTDALLAAPA